MAQSSPSTSGPEAQRARAAAGVHLIVNGEPRSFEGVGDVAALVASLGLDSRKVAVELNLAIVPRSAYAVTPVAEGDRIEIVHFIGGG
jgi:thiamine biosynthesis protein ThiS